jgi:hypothetical protein
MAERDDRMAQDARNAQSGQNSGNQNAGSKNAQGDDQAGLDRALQRSNEDLAGDLETNRNLTGSTTYETLHEQGDLDVASGRSDENAGGSSGGSSGGSGGKSGGMR